MTRLCITKGPHLLFTGGNGHKTYGVRVMNMMSTETWVIELRIVPGSTRSYFANSARTWDASWYARDINDPAVKIYKTIGGARRAIDAHGGWASYSPNIIAVQQ